MRFGIADHDGRTRWEGCSGYGDGRRWRKGAFRAPSCGPVPAVRPTHSGHGRVGEGLEGSGQALREPHRSLLCSQSLSILE